VISDAADRIDSLKSKIKHYGSASEETALLRKTVCARLLGETAGQPQVIRMAKILAAFLREKDIVVFEEDRLAGFQQFYDFICPVDLPCLGDERFLPSDDPDHLAFAKAAEPDDEGVVVAERFSDGVTAGLFSHCLGGHTIAGYERLMALGFGGLIDAARSRMTTAQDAAREFAEASLIVCEAARDYVLRYADKAREMAVIAADDESRSRFQQMADACGHVATQPPRSLLEAAQLVSLTHEIITCEQPSGSLSLGRLDQYLHPFYESDLATGRLTKDDAEEIFQALWLKFGALEGGYQNVTLGGCDGEGRYVGNDLTVMGLRVSMRLKMDQPLVSFRWHPSMPDELWEPVLELIREGLGFPALFNDDVVIDAKCRVGISPTDAADYGIVGCVEMNAPGKEWSQTEAVRINWAKVLELMLNDGECPLTGKDMQLASPQPLAALASFDEFLSAFKQVLVEAVDLGVRATILRDKGFGVVSPYPFLSSTMVGCLEAGLDVAQGGTTYNLLTVNNCGMADTVDSLLAVKRLVYDEQRLTLPELAEALRKNFEGAEELRAQLTSDGQRFGNDQDEADSLMQELSELLHDRLQGYRNTRGGGVQMGMYTVAAHAFLGSMTGALPSGRPAKVSLANGFSPCQGGDTSGPTAVVKSLTKLDHGQFGNGMVLDLKFSPALLEGPQERNALRKLIETYFELGGMEIQFNVISRDTLLAAQASPEEYEDLIVRVSGFSAYFVNLDRLCQDEIIARTEHGAIS
jgi:formate C-acetyltransferase